MSQGERRLAAIMYTDMVGYTSLGQEDESASLDLLERHRQLLRPVFVKHSGHEVKSMGDAFLVEFASALEATLCAIDVQSSIHSMKLERGEKMQVRIGIHVGDVMHQGNDVLGDAVNVASRIEPLARPGGITISEQVQGHIKNKIPYPLTRLAPRELKNVREHIDVYRVVLPWEGKEIDTGVDLQLDKRRLAVLPFANMSPDPSDEFFADGLTEEMISDLSGVQGLCVIARTSIMHYKKTEKNVGEIARELGVGSVLEGSVRKAGNKIRITAQLIDVGDGSHLWTQKFDRELSDIFEVQSEIAGSITKALELKLLQGDESSKLRKMNPDVFALCLKARELWNKRTKEELEHGILLFKEALRLDPNSARAYAGLADCYYILADRRYVDINEGMATAKKYLSQAVFLDENLPEVHATMGSMFLSEMKYDLAEGEFQRAISLNPNYASAHQWYSQLLMEVGRFDEGLRHVEKAAEFDPLSPIILRRLSIAYYHAGRSEEAMVVCNRILLAEPNDVNAHFIRAYMHAKEGRRKEAFDDLEDYNSLKKDELSYRVLRAELEETLGDKETALMLLREVLPQLRDSQEPNQYLPYYIYADLGDTESFFEWIDYAIERQMTSAADLRYNPQFRKMREDPRFKELYKRFNLPG